MSKAIKEIINEIALDYTNTMTAATNSIEEDIMEVKAKEIEIWKSEMLDGLGDSDIDGGIPFINGHIDIKRSIRAQTRATDLVRMAKLHTNISLSIKMKVTLLNMASDSAKQNYSSKN